MSFKQDVAQQQDTQGLPEIQKRSIEHFWKQPVPQKLNYKSLC